MLLQLVSHAVEQLAESSVPKLRTTLQSLLARLGTQLGIDRTTLCTLNPDRQGFRVLVSWSAPSIPVVESGQLHATHSLLVRRILNGEIIRFDRLDPSVLPNTTDRTAIERNRQRSLLALPLRVAGGTVGAHLFGGVEQGFRWSRRFVDAISILCPALALALERLRLHDQLEQCRKEHLDTQRLAGMGHWRYTFATRGCLASPELYQMLQLDPRTEFDPHVMPPRIAPVDRGAFERHLRTLLAGATSPPIECRMNRSRGETVWLRSWAELSCHPDGSPQFVHGIVHDITEQRRAEQIIEATSGRLVRAQEEERTRLGRELHDELGQRIAALTITVGSLHQKAQTQADAEPLADPLGQVTEQLSELGSIVRSLSHSLHPAELRRLGLRLALASLCRRISMLTEVDVEMEKSTIPDDLSEDTALALYRVAQESLSNAIRHGQPQRAVISLSVNDQCLRLRVSDDGRGFCPETLADDAGLGLLGMQERMRLVRGALRIESEEGHGAVIEATVPLDAPDPSPCQEQSSP